MEEKFRDYAQLYEAIRYLATENKRLTDESKKVLEKVEEIHKLIKKMNVQKPPLKKEVWWKKLWK